jgi:hypothetical protein
VASLCGEKSREHAGKRGCIAYEITAVGRAGRNGHAGDLHVVGGAYERLTSIELVVNGLHAPVGDHKLCARGLSLNAESGKHDGENSHQQARRAAPSALIRGKRS